MPLSMYQASAPVFLHGLSALSGVLDKAAAHAQAKKIDESVFIQARLFPDMLPFNRQIQIATDSAKGCVARLAGLESPRMEDTETSFEALKARIAKTQDFIRSVDAGQVDGSEEREIVLPIGPDGMKFKGQAFLLHFALPNFFFHLTTAYGLLRHNGVEVGKRDFLGGM